MTTQAVLSIRDVTVRFGGVTAVKGVSFDVAQNEIVGLIGPNGAGKTTLLNAISHLETIASGSISCFGERVSDWAPHRMAAFGIARTFQVVQPFANLTVRENVRVGAMFARGRHEHARVAAAVDEAIELTGLQAKADLLPHQVTLADRKRLELARALAMQPRLLLLDEVMAGLNHTEIGKVITLIKAIRDKGVTILVVEHVMKAITAICDRIVVLQFGEKIADDRPERVLSDEKVVRAYLGDRYAARQAALAQGDAR